MHARTLGLTAVLFATLAADATSQTLKVPSDDYPTIQDAIDAADPGARISVKSGDYYEQLVIPPGKDGLEISGSKKTRVIRPIEMKGEEEGVSSTNGVLVQSNDVTLKGFTILQAQSNGVRAEGVIGPDPGEDPPRLQGLTLDRLTVINPEQDGLRIFADDLVVTGCTFFGCDGGLDIDGDGVEIRKTSVTNDCTIGITIDGETALVDGCTVRTIEDGDAIDIEGDGATVTKCKVFSSDGYGIEVNGADATISKNTLECIEDDGIYVSGDGALIDGNRLSGFPDDTIGIYLSGEGGTISKNRVDDAVEHGIEVSGDGNTVSKNSVTDCGAEDESGIEVDGANNVIEGNRVKGGDSSCIEVDGDDNMLIKNNCSGASDNGILVDGGSDNVLDGNSCSKNFGDGIENQGTDTVIRQNRLSGNLQDLSSNGGNYIDEGGNKFKTGAVDAPPVNDD